MISELYLKRAASIKKEYLSIIGNISKYENMVKDFIKILELRSSEMQDIYARIESNKISNAEIAKKEIFDIMTTHEDDVNKLEKTINKLNDDIERLKQDEVKLYQEIKNVYFNLSDEEIKSQVQEHLKKQNLS